jgi:uncharacterized membrane protein
MFDYQLIKWIHVLSATVLFGTGLGTAFHFWMAHRTGDVNAIAVAARITVIADFIFTLPAAVVQPLSGIALALMAGFSLRSDWMLASIALYLVAGACWIPVVFIQMRLRRLAEQSVRDGNALPASYRRLAWIWFALGWPAFIALLAVLWLMVAKPPLS